MSPNTPDDERVTTIGHLREMVAERDATIKQLREALYDLGDYHDDAGPESVYTQGRVAEVLGDDWWEQGLAAARADALGEAAGG